MTAKKTFFLGALIVVLLILYNSLYVISEGQQALLLSLGKIVQKNGQALIIEPGLHIKIPFFNQVKKLDVRLQTAATQSSRILTQDAKFVIVDYYIKWRVRDLPVYYQRTGGDSYVAQSLLQQQVNDALRAAFGERTLTDMVSGERINVMALLKASANKTAKNLGIGVADVRIKSIDLPKEVSNAVFNNMSTGREKAAMKYRADGKAKAETVRAKADTEASLLVAQAQMKAAKIRASGIAKSAHIYSTAYEQDPDFYAFYRSLQAYLAAFNGKNDFLVLTPESNFFQYFDHFSPTSAVKKDPAKLIAQQRSAE